MKYQVKTNKGIVTIETVKPIEYCSDCPLLYDYLCEPATCLFDYKVGSIITRAMRTPKNKECCPLEVIE